MYIEPSVIAFDGLGRGLTPEIYRWVTQNFRFIHSELAGQLDFIGSPFERRRFSFPLAMTEEEGRLTVIHRLLKCWGWMDQFTQDKLLPTLARGKIAVILRYGLGSALYTLACVDCPTLEAEVLEAHWALVKLRVKSQMIPDIHLPLPAPQYMVPEEEPAHVTEEATSNVRALRGVLADNLRGYVAFERDFVNRYCHESNGQQTPWWIRGKTFEEKCYSAVEMIAAHVQQRIARAA